MKKALLISFVLVLTAAVAFAEPQAEYPTRDITNVLVWAAGGGTDLANRLVMAEMAKVLKVNINVVNVTGGVGRLGRACSRPTASRPTATPWPASPSPASPPACRAAGTSASTCGNTSSSAARRTSSR